MVSKGDLQTLSLLTASLSLAPFMRTLPHLLIFLRSFLMAAMIYPANIHDSEFEMLVIKKLIGRSLRLKLLANGVV